jgi:hypothetical protein
MQSGNPRISLNKTERALILPGLNLIVARHAGAAAGFLPHRHPWDGVDFQASDVYKQRAYDEGMAAKLTSLRTKLNTVPPRGKLRLDAFEFAAAALSFRVTRKKQLWSQALRAGNEDASPQQISETMGAIAQLEKKLERYRRRAVRAAIRRIGKAVYKEQAQIWRAFVRAIRFNLLYDVDQAGVARLARRPASTARTWKYQYETLLEMARDVVAQRTTATISDIEMRRLVTLAKNELRRGRHDITLTEAIDDRDQGKEMLFNFIGKRFELDEHIRLKFADLSVQQSARGDKFRAATIRSCEDGPAVSPVGNMVTPTPATVQSNKTVTGTERRVLSKDSTVAKPGGCYTKEEKEKLVSEGKGKRIPPQDIELAIAKWLREHLHPIYWGRFRQEVEAQVKRFPEAFRLTHLTNLGRIKYVTVEDIIRRCRPGNAPKVEDKYITYHVNWIMKVMRTMYQHASDAQRAVTRGIREAGLQMSPSTWRLLPI